jgi:retron-type reverse transcriptase
MTYEEICKFETLYQAYLKARKGKRSRPSTQSYEANALACTEKVSEQLARKRYRPGEFNTFYIYEPKRRLIQAPAFVDKVVLHAIVDNALYKAIADSFVRDNAASQIGKGVEDALSRLRGHMTGYYRQHGSADGWVVKCDVRHFFASIDHDRLKEKLLRLFERRGLDMQIYELLCIYIDTSEGLPLGYQTSQLLALLYLDEYDHMIKETYRCHYYGRYMDDFYMIAATKDEARRLLAATRAWMAENKLELNEKTAIFPLRNGLDFLGFHTYLTDSGKAVMRLRRCNVNKLKSNIRYWQKAFPAGEITKEKVRDSWQAWDAHASYGDTYALRVKYAGIVGGIIGERLQPSRRKRSTRAARHRRYLRQLRAINRKAAARLGLPEIETGGVSIYGICETEREGGGQHR